jgi:glycosyltransferase involved in cell wall biosynthesis
MKEDQSRQLKYPESSLLQNNSHIWNKVRQRYFSATGLSCVVHAGSSNGVHYHGSYKNFSTQRNISEKSRYSLLMVNHGYPPLFNGGSEVYAQTLALELLRSNNFNNVTVLAREHDPFRPDFELRKTVDSINSNLPVYLMNYPREAAYYRFQQTEIDDIFRLLMKELNPMVVHFHHLNHLSLNLPFIASTEFKAKVVYTLHDFWLMCPRGQFLITGVTTPIRNEPWQLCTSQDDKKCASNCFTNRYSTGISDNEDLELEYWTNWVAARMNAVRNMCKSVDTFISPSVYLQQRYIEEFNLPRNKIHHLPYGFDKIRLSGRERIYDTTPSVNNNNSSDSNKNPKCVFAYIGRHQPAKGIQLLVKAALQIIRDDPAMIGRFAIKIYGRSDMNSNLAMQRDINKLLPVETMNEVFQWHNEYNNTDIVRNVFNSIDAIVVPSIWMENSPLVIQEALQCQVPVITANCGGMSELIQNEVNGLTFEHRNSSSLSSAMLKVINNPLKMQELGKRGYLHSDDGHVTCIKKHCDDINGIYESLLY